MTDNHYSSYDDNLLLDEFSGDGDSYGSEDNVYEDEIGFIPDPNDYEEEANSLGDDEEDLLYEDWIGGDGYYIVHLFAIQNELLDPIVEHLNHDISFVGAWLCVCQDLPGVQGLADLKRLHPTALPSWLALEKTADILPYLDVRDGNHVVFKENLAADTKARATEREAQLERFKGCRFQEGFASEGMLCNSPPIPLRVLDYLDAADLLSLSLVCKATHRASHYLFHLEEEVLARPDIQTPHLRPTTISLPARHRAMRAASLICGRPETIDLTKHNPSLLHNLVASADACTQPHVGWETYWNENDESLADILQARNVTSMPAGNQRFCSTVDPEGWPSRDQEGITKLRHKLSQYTANGGSTEHLSGYEVVAMHELEQNLEKNLDGVGRVFEAACKRKQVVVMFQDWSE